MHLVRHVSRTYGDEPVVGVIESMNGGRFVHDTLEQLGWSVEIADAKKVKGLAPLACKTDRIDAFVLAELSRRDLARLSFPEPWSSDVRAALSLIDTLDTEIDEAEATIRRLVREDPATTLLMSVPGIGFVLAYTIAAEIGDIARFASPKKLMGYTGLCPRVYQSGGADHRGSLSKNGPRYRWRPRRFAVRS